MNVYAFPSQSLIFSLYKTNIFFLIMDLMGVPKLPKLYQNQKYIFARPRMIFCIKGNHRNLCTSWYVIHVDELGSRHNLNNREGQANSTHIEKYIFTWTTKSIRCYPEFYCIFIS